MGELTVTRLFVYVQTFDRWELIVESEYGIGVMDAAKAYRRRYPTRTLKVTFPGDTYTIWNGE